MDSEVFTGFKPAIEACYLDWDDYPMPGITYTQDINPMYHCPFTCFRHGADNNRGESQVTQVSYLFSQIKTGLCVYLVDEYSLVINNHTNRKNKS